MIAMLQTKETESVTRRLEQAREQIQATALVAGQDILDPARFAEDTAHMVVVDVFSRACPVGNAGERLRLFLTEDGYQQAVESAGRREMTVRRHAKVQNGALQYDEVAETLE